MTTLDNDGYPTDEFLEYVKKFEPENIWEFIETLRSGWWMDDWGFILHRKYKGYRKLELHTGGWSGNEDTINALHESFFFNFYWRKTYVGGHYYFKIPCK
jgi:hypothetical protein